MSAIYVASFQNITVAAVQDLFELKAATTVAVEIRRIRITTVRSASEVLRMVASKYTGTAPTSGSGGAAVTPSPNSITYAAAASVVERNNTTKITGGTKVIIFDHQWNTINPFEWVPIDRTGLIEIGPGLTFELEIFTTPTSGAWGGELEFSEVG